VEKSGIFSNFLLDFVFFCYLTPIALLEIQKTNIYDIVFLKGLPKTMCQAQPGPRCYNDSSRRLGQLEKRVGKYVAECDDLEKSISKAVSENKASEVKKLSERKTAVTNRLETVKTELRHTQRDVDGTLTGRRKLNDEIASASDPALITELETRLKTGQGQRFAREHALERLNSGKPAPIRFAMKAA
jgi:regulator of replication initiation timing